MFGKEVEEASDCSTLRHFARYPGNSFPRLLDIYIVPLVEEASDCSTLRHFVNHTPRRHFVNHTHNPNPKINSIQMSSPRRRIETDVMKL